jgi:hypothetical protein
MQLVVVLTNGHVARLVGFGYSRDFHLALLLIRSNALKGILRNYCFAIAFPHRNRILVGLF